jgi:UDP-2,3-diacylglucosamine hydrolase
MTHYFISDLHLSEKRPDLLQAFFSLSQRLQENSKIIKDCHLHIVGDFYEAWIGDDYQSSWINEIETCLIGLSKAGIKIRVYHGNRDFLLGPSWATRTGVTLVKDHYCLAFKSRNIFITHGDEACIDDVEYQKFRLMVRQEQWQEQVLSLPLTQRIALASQLREDSKQSNNDKMLDIMDVDTHEIDRLMQLNSAHLMIHGHTHRPALHQQENGTRLVLGDWDKFAWIAVLDDTQIIQYKVALELLSDQTLDLTRLLINSEKAQSLTI